MFDFTLKKINYMFYGGYVNTYILASKHTVILIDSAVGSAKQMLCEEIEKAKIGNRKFLLLNTHMHWDHASLNGYLKKQYGATICGAKETFTLCDRDKQFHELYGGYEQLHPGFGSIYDLYMDEFQYPAPVDKILLDGDRIQDGDLSLRIIRTPGHSNDSLSFYEESTGILFAGDAIQGNGFDGNAPFYCSANDYVHTIDCINQIRPEMILCGHGMFESAASCVKLVEDSYNKIEAFDDAALKVMHLPLEQQAATACTLLREKFGYPDTIHLLTTVNAHLARVRNSVCAEEGAYAN